MKKLTLFLLITLSIVFQLKAQGKEHSLSRIWTDGLLEAIKQEGSGPTIQSRNLFHLSMAIYDSWAVYESQAETYLLGKKRENFISEFEGFKIPINLDSARNVTISYAAYTLITRRFQEYSGKGRMMDGIISLADSIGLDRWHDSKDYKTSPAALGVYIAEQVLNYGAQDGAGDFSGYEADYGYLNPLLKPNEPGTILRKKNRWQPLSLVDYTNERGWDNTLPDWNHLILGNQDIFLTPQWGNLPPFSLKESDKSILSRDNQEFIVYKDPGPPPYMSATSDKENSDAYKWNFALVSIWSSHLDPDDKVMIDISPNGIGGRDGDLPSKYSEYDQFFSMLEGGSRTSKRTINPKTGKKYAKNIVPRGDYTRVIAEYWVDGVNTYSPPGHWVKILGDVSDSPDLIKKWKNKGKVLNELEWDVKSYFYLCASLYDAGISSWSIKAYYDYVRPISAIRWMAGMGQSSNEKLPNYNIEGIPLIKGKIELVKKGDPLAGEKNKHLNKIKVYSWKGPDYIDDIRSEHAGVGWILAENWWPYQKYSFATPPFPGFVSGHSTFSSAGAKALELITNDPYFPGGLAEFTAKKNEFLVFEEGPSQDITLQWATYQDAADETCLSRIWGGIHPPADDIPGRKIGANVAEQAFDLSNKYFEGKVK